MYPVTSLEQINEVKDCYSVSALSKKLSLAKFFELLETPASEKKLQAALHDVFFQIFVLDKTGDHEGVCLLEAIRNSIDAGENMALRF